MNEAWSRDEEYFYAKELCEFIADEGLQVGDVVYRGTSVEVRTIDLVGADRYLEEVQDRAMDLLGEVAEDYPGLPSTKIAELNSLIAAWLDIHCPHKFFEVVGVTEYTITQEDLEL